MPKITDSERARALGSAGGRASAAAKAKRKNRSPLDALRAKVFGDPDAFAETLMANTDGAIVAARLLERSGGLGPPQQENPVDGVQPGGGVEALRSLVRNFVANGGEEWLFGFRLSDEQRALLLDAEEGEAPEIERSPVASEESLRVRSSSGTEGPTSVSTNVDTGGPSSDSGSRDPIRPEPKIQGDPAAEAVRKWRQARGLPTSPGDPYGTDGPPRRLTTTEAISEAFKAKGMGP